MKKIPNILSVYRLAILPVLLYLIYVGNQHLSASLVKRKTQLKDFSQLLPGQGGILDRFDSYMATTLWALFFIF